MESTKGMNSTQIYRAHEGFQRNFVRSNVSVCFGGGILGGGKLHPLDTNILTPNGWVKIGLLKEGDFVNTPFDAPAKVLRIFEHKDKEIYRLTTSDGRSVECGLEHLWSIRTQKQMYKYHNGGNKGDYLTICDTAELINRLKKSKKSYIPTPDAQEFSEKDFVIPPYVLGVMIGDGCLTDSTWVPDNAFFISNTEQDVINKVASLTKTTSIYEQKSNFTKKFYSPFATQYKTYCTKIGLNTYSYNKFIPDEYLWGSIKQRKELLAGLFDTDGHVGDNGCYSYSTTSHQLCDNIITLCRSLGYIVTVSYDKRTDKYTNGKAFKICIQTSEKIFTSKKHNLRWEKIYSKEKKFVRKRDHVFVVSIEKKRVADARCIYIDNPLHLYIVDDFIVTHNTFGAVLATAEPSLDPNWRGLFLRNNLDDAKSAGGVLDTFKELYGDSIQIRTADMPRVVFPSGAYVDVTHVADQSVETILRRFKGRQYDMIYFDELSSFTWDCFKTILSRNRGKSAYAGKCLATTNPERECWIRDFIDWYIDPEGYIMEERSGVVRYFYMMGPDVKDIVWSETPDGVYQLCKSDIDKKLDKVYGFMQGRDKWPSMIKSFSFYLGKLSENKEMLEANPDYVGSIAMSGGAEADKLLMGNWNVSSKDEEGVLVTYDEANSVFTNDPQRNHDRWVTCDLADLGTNNYISLAWDGLDIIDIEILTESRPAENAAHLKAFAARNDVADPHIIFDALRAGIYIQDYIPSAIAFEGYKAPFGIDSMQYMKLKDYCYGKFIWLVKNGYISCTDDVAKMTFIHKKIKDRITIQDEFIREIRLVRFLDAQNGKKRLPTKKELNKHLGSGQSMDIMDCCIMRMYPLLNVANGYELEHSRREYEQYQDELETGSRVNIYDETIWG